MSTQNAHHHIDEMKRLIHTGSSVSTVSSSETSFKGGRPGPRAVVELWLSTPLL